MSFGRGYLADWGDCSWPIAHAARLSPSIEAASLADCHHVAMLVSLHGADRRAVHVESAVTPPAAVALEIRVAVTPGCHLEAKQKSRAIPWKSVLPDLRPIEVPTLPTRSCRFPPAEAGRWAFSSWRARRHATACNGSFR